MGGGRGGVQKQRTPFFIVNDLDRPEGFVESYSNEDLKVPFSR